MKKYFLYQFAAFGDCLFATIIAKQIKLHEPDSEITWGISKRYVSVLKNNPYVDYILEFECDPKLATKKDFEIHEIKVEEIEKSGNYEFIYLQILNRHIHRLITTLRYTILQIYGIPIINNINAVLVLDLTERENVLNFISKKGISKFKKKILFECAPSSGQSNVNMIFALKIAETITKNRNDVCFILTGPNKIEEKNNKIFSADTISIRENLALLNECDLLIGCSSGISWLTICEDCKPIDTIQLLNDKSDIFASMHFDFEVNQINNSHILEMTNYNEKRVCECIDNVLNFNFKETKNKFHQSYKPGIYNLKNNIMKLIWLNYTLPQINQYINDFIYENRKFNNLINVSFFLRFKIVISSIAYKYYYFSKLKIVSICSKRK